MIELRDLTTDDLDLLVKWRNDPLVTQYLSLRLNTREKVDAWFGKLRESPKVWLKGIVCDSQLIGYAVVESIDEENRRCELVMVIGESDYWGKRIGSSVLAEMLKYAFEEIDVHRVWTVVTEGNIRSERMIKGAGFVKEGVMREVLLKGDKFISLLGYSMLEQEYRDRIKQE